MSEVVLSTERQAKISNDLTRVWKGKKVTDAFNADRLEDLFVTMEAFTDRGKCLDWSIVFTPESQMEFEGPLRVLEHPDHIHWEEEFRNITALAVVFGEQGFSLEEDDASDWQLSASKNGGFFIRKPTQALPLAVFKRHHYSDFSMIRNEVEKIVEKHIFGSPAKLPHQSQVVSRNRNLNSTPAYNPRKVHLWDVMCDRKDPRCPGHFGNRRFSIIVCMYMSKDYNLKDVTVRVRIARSIILTVRNGDPGGRFLARTTRGTWKEIDDTLAIKWISLILKVADQKTDEDPKNRKEPKVIADSVKYSMHPDDDMHPPAAE